MVALTATASASQTHTHKVSGGTVKVSWPKAAWFQSYAGKNSSDWTASTPGKFEAGPSSSCR